jgi:hypothetical protein
MQRQKTRFEQVPVEVAEKVLRQATVLADERRSRAPLSAQEREATAEFPRRRGNGARKERA